MKKVVIYLEGAQENERALALAYAAERTINDTYGVEGMVQVKSLQGMNWLRWLLSRRRMPVKGRLTGGAGQ